MTPIDVILFVLIVGLAALWGMTAVRLRKLEDAQARPPQSAQRRRVRVVR